MIQIQQLKIRPDHTREELQELIFRKLRITDTKNAGSLVWSIARQSVDARKKDNIEYVYTIHVSAPGEKQILRRCGKDRSITRIKKQVYHMPPAGSSPLHMRPVIIGAGPAGLFCGLQLAKAGFSPLILERGDDVDTRSAKVEQFWNKGELDPESNVQFGEGGAGTFSDGKLNTAIRDESGRIEYVLSTFVHCGADPDILSSYKPHIGTDILRSVVKNMRREIESLGGRILFRHRFDALRQIKQTDQAGKAQFLYELTIRCPEEKETGCLQSTRSMTLQTQVLILALGHSARDTFSMLQNNGMQMQAKAFAVGVRIQHPQEMINRAMYGENCPYELGAAPYKLTASVESADGKKRGVYSFCMCPGGYVVNASSRNGELAVNGMSLHDRDAGNANSAIVVTVSPEDYKAKDPLDGVRFQEKLEKKAWELGEGRIPVQTFGDFRQDIPSEGPGQVLPVMKGRICYTNLRRIFPGFINDALSEGIVSFGKQIKGFDREDALLSAVESRTSSPVRLNRSETYESMTHPFIYPCGEGAGYAGGITSAAVDGMKVAEAVIKHFYVDFSEE